MVGDKIKYTCKNCGSFTSIREEWADLKPKRCMNRKCNTSFIKFPDALVVQMPNQSMEMPPTKVASIKKGKKSEAQDN